MNTTKYIGALLLFALGLLVVKADTNIVNQEFWITIQGTNCPGGDGVHHMFGWKYLAGKSRLYGKLQAETNSFQFMTYTNGMTNEYCVQHSVSNNYLNPQTASYYARFPDSCGWRDHPLDWPTATWKMFVRWVDIGTQQWTGSKNWTNYSFMPNDIVECSWYTMPYVVTSSYSPDHDSDKIPVRVLGTGSYLFPDIEPVQQIYHNWTTNPPPGPLFTGPHLIRNQDESPATTTLRLQAIPNDVMTVRVASTNLPYTQLVGDLPLDEFGYGEMTLPDYYWDQSFFQLSFTNAP